MISASTMGIIFPNLHDENLPELLNQRTMASMPFAGRYRMIDFCLSAMSRAGMQNVGVIAKRNFQSLMDHLGSGREWDLSRKLGGLVIFPPYARDAGTYNGHVEALASIMEYLERSREDLVVLSDCNIAFNIDIKQLLAAHWDSGADITMVYERAQVQPGVEKDNVALTLREDGFVREIRVNEYKRGEQNLFMNMYVVGREFLIGLVREAMVRGQKQFVRDVLARSLRRIHVQGYEFTGYRARIYDMQSYFNESMRLISPANLRALFPRELPVYTKVRDEAPVRYAIDASVYKSIVADGCIIEGSIENCVLFRGVRVGKGAVLKNCVVMQGSEICSGVQMENVITDKNVWVGEGQSLRGAGSYPVFLPKGSQVV